MWFTETESRLGRIDASGHVTELPIPRPANRIVAGPDGNLWFTSEEHLSRMTPAGEVTEFGASGRMFGITVGPDGHIWFTNSVSIGRSTVNGEITEFPFEIDGAVDLAFGADGYLWMANPGEFAGNPQDRSVLTVARRPCGFPGSRRRNRRGLRWQRLAHELRVQPCAPARDPVGRDHGLRRSGVRSGNRGRARREAVVYGENGGPHRRDDHQRRC